MSAQTLPGSWNGNLDELAHLANVLLPQYLPLDRPNKLSRSQDEVNPRLIRHYTTQGLLDAPLKEGREARYTRHHLLQLLTLRRLMTEGLSAQAIQGLLAGQDDTQLEAVLSGQSRLQVQTSNPALDYLAAIRQQSLPEAAPSPAPASPSAAAPAPAPSRYSRLPLAPGLELHVSQGARLPRTPAEQDALARQLLLALDTLRRTP